PTGAQPAPAHADPSGTRPSDRPIPADFRSRARPAIRLATTTGRHQNGQPRPCLEPVTDLAEWAYHQPWRVSPPTIGRFSFGSRILRPINGLCYTRQPLCIIRASRVNPRAAEMDYQAG